MLRSVQRPDAAVAGRGRRTRQLLAAVAKLVAALRGAERLRWGGRGRPAFFCALSRAVCPPLAAVTATCGHERTFRGGAGWGGPGGFWAPRRVPCGDARACIISESQMPPQLPPSSWSSPIISAVFTP